MKQLYITLLLTLFSSYAFAQKDFRDGYLVQNGDTIKGQLDYRGSQRSSKMASFRATAASEEQTFSPTQIQAFGFLNEARRFEAREIPSQDTAQVPETLFLEVLVKGQANLYFYRDKESKDHFYLAKGTQPLKELRKVTFEQKDPTTGRKYVVQQEPYKPILMQAFGDCPTVTEGMINQINIGHNALANITRRYNSCVSNEVYSKVPRTAVFTFGLVAAGNLASLEFGSRDDKMIFEGNLKPSAGLFMNVSSPAFSEKLAIQAELLLTSSFFRSEYKIYSTAPGSRTGETWFYIKYLKLPVQLRYTYPRGKIRPFANVGPSISYAVQQKNEFKLTTTFGGTTRTTTEEALSGSAFRKYSTGFTAGIGLAFKGSKKPIFLEGRYERTDGISNISNLPSTLQFYYIMLSFQL